MADQEHCKESASFDLVCKRFTELESELERMRGEISQVHSDLNIERGFNRIFRVLMVIMMMFMVGMFAWVSVNHTDAMNMLGNKLDVLTTKIHIHTERTMDASE